MPRFCLTVQLTSSPLQGYYSLLLPVLPSAQHKKPYLTQNFLQLIWFNVTLGFSHLTPTWNVLIYLKMLKEQ